MIKYFLEHKTLNTWVVYDGTLTNNPNEAGLITFKDEFTAKKHLKPIEPTVSTSFDGSIVNTDYMGVRMWNHLRNRLKENTGADLYEDFLVTEHEFAD